jgi:hypothetical protein
MNARSAHQLATGERLSTPELRVIAQAAAEDLADASAEE